MGFVWEGNDDIHCIKAEGRIGSTVRLNLLSDTIIVNEASVVVKEQSVW